MDKMLVTVFPAAYEGLSALIKEELAQASGDARAAVQKEIDTVKKKLEEMKSQAKAKVEKAKSDVDAKIEAMITQMKQASDLQKAEIEKQIHEVKSDYAVRICVPPAGPTQ